MERRVGADALLDVHHRIRPTAPIVSIVTARSRREARSTFSLWARAIRGRLVISPSPTASAARAVCEEWGTEGLVILFLGDELERVWREAGEFLKTHPNVDVAVAARITQVVATITNPTTPVSSVAGIIQGLVPVDPVEKEILADVVRARRLAPILRSPYEGLLFFILEARTETRTLFEANKRLAGFSGTKHEVDLVDEAHRLIVEIDGRQHDSYDQASHDAFKQKDLEDQGYLFRRYATAEVAERPNEVWQDVLHTVNLRRKHGEVQR